MRVCRRSMFLRRRSIMASVCRRRRLLVFLGLSCRHLSSLGCRCMPSFRMIRSYIATGLGGMLFLCWGFSCMRLCCGRSSCV